MTHKIPQILALILLSTCTAITSFSQSKLRPRYLDLRFDEDFSYLDRAEDEYQKDFADPIKRIHLSRTLALRLGGEIRYRYEAETNKFLKTSPQDFDGFLLDRYVFHADLNYRNRFRFFTEFVHANVHDRDELLFYIHRNRHDIHQMFGELMLLEGKSRLRLRVGRQELSYGSERLVSATGWGRTRKRFDSIKLLWNLNAWKVDVWYSWPVVVDTDYGDKRNKDLGFAGVFSSLSLGPKDGLDVYYFLLNNDVNTTNQNGRNGNMLISTIGLRKWGVKNAIDYEIEINGQLGKWAGDKVRAWSAGGSLGYRFTSVSTQPRAAIRFDIASGDQNPNDDKVGTFQQHFRQEKFHLGYLVLFGRQNIATVNATAGTFLIPRKVKLDIFIYQFWLQSKRDRLYNPGAFAVPGRYDAVGNLSSVIGNEVDITLGWQVNVHHSLVAGVLKFWNRRFLKQTGGGDNPADVFFQYKFMF